MPPTTNLDARMEVTSKKALESFAQHLLGEAHAITVQTAELARKGYDVGLLMDLVAEYSGVPAAERAFIFEKDFTKLGTRDNFGLHIRRP